MRDTSLGGNPLFLALAISLISLLLLAPAAAPPSARAATGDILLVSADAQGSKGPPWSSCHPSISADGRYVAFHANSSNLVPGDTNGWRDLMLQVRGYDVFVHDRQTGTTERVSVATDGSQGDLDSRDPTISADGRCVAFRSDASNLVPGDTNTSEDIFVHDRQTAITERVSVASNVSQAQG